MDCLDDFPPLETHDCEGKQNTRLPETWTRTDTGQDLKLRSGERGVLGEAGRVRWDQILPPCAKWATFRRLHSQHITCLALPHPLLGMHTMTILVVVGILEVCHQLYASFPQASPPGTNHLPNRNIHEALSLQPERRIRPEPISY